MLSTKPESSKIFCFSFLLKKPWKAGLQKGDNLLQKIIYFFWRQQFILYFTVHHTTCVFLLDLSWAFIKTCLKVAGVGRAKRGSRFLQQTDAFFSTICSDIVTRHVDGWMDRGRGWSLKCEGGERCPSQNWLITVIQSKPTGWPCPALIRAPVWQSSYRFCFLMSSLGPCGISVFHLLSFLDESVVLFSPLLIYEFSFTSSAHKLPQWSYLLISWCIIIYLSGRIFCFWGKKIAS